MPRPLRIHVENGFYHVTLRGNHQQMIFRAPADRALLEAIVAKTLQGYDARLHAYCWMTNHLHFLLQVGTQPLGVVMRQIASGYARAFQLKLETTGHLFERRYHARLVAHDAYLLALLRYIHLNPVAGDIVQRPLDYPWSSHRAYAGGRPAPWLTTDFVLALFAADRARARAAYLRFMEEGDPAWHPEDDELPGDLSRSTGMESPAPLPAPPPTAMPPPAATRQTFEALLTETSAKFSIAAAILMSDSREPLVVQARGWLTDQALTRGIATLSEVSRRLGRDRSTLRYAVRRRVWARS